MTLKDCLTFVAELSLLPGLQKTIAGILQLLLLISSLKRMMKGQLFINCPDDLTVGVDVDECSAYVIYSTPIAEDCNGVESVVLTSGIPSGQNFPLGSTTIIFTATDECGNESTCEFDITVVDTDDPTILCPSNDVVVCADLGGCDWESDSSISPTLAIENCPNYTITYEITGATNASGNDDAAGEILISVLLSSLIPSWMPMAIRKLLVAFNVIVEDCEAPTIDCYDELDVECTFEDVDAWIASIEATASDLCSDVEVETILFLDISSCGNTIEQQYLFTVTDAAGNTLLPASLLMNQMIQPILQLTKKRKI